MSGCHLGFGAVVKAGGPHSRGAACSTGGRVERRTLGLKVVWQGGRAVQEKW